MNNYDKRFDDPDFVQAYNYVSQLAEEDREQYSDEELNTVVRHMIHFGNKDAESGLKFLTMSNLNMSKAMCLWAQMQKAKHHRLMFAVFPLLEAARAENG